jgi:hypothetical protein
VLRQGEFEGVGEEKFVESEMVDDGGEEYTMPFLKIKKKNIQKKRKKVRG